MKRRLRKPDVIVLFKRAHQRGVRALTQAEQAGRFSGVWQWSFVTSRNRRLQLESAVPGAFVGNNQRGD